MKVGDYVRTEYGVITKIDKIVNFEQENQKPYLNFKNMLVWTENDSNVAGSRGIIIKSSPNIIDLIEVGDYVNGIKITSVYDDDKEANDYNLKHKKCLGTNVYDEDYQEKLIYEEDIKSIVTKEQFESMEYRIGE